MMHQNSRTSIYKTGNNQNRRKHNRKGRKKKKDIEIYGKASKE